MPLLHPLPDPVPPDEVAAVLAEAIRIRSGGPACVAMVTGRDMAMALDLAGMRVVRDGALGRQLTL